MKKIVTLICLLFCLSFAQAQTLNCDSLTAIVPCDSVYSAFSELNSFYASGSDSGIIFSSTFATLYLSIRYQNYGLDPSTWGSILVCCTPPNVTFEDTLTSCDTVALMGLNIQYALPPTPRGSCYPAWVYNSLLSVLVINRGDTSINQLNQDLNACGYDSIDYCIKALNNQCDSMASILGVYNIMLYNEGQRIDTALLDNVYSFLYNGAFLPYKQIIGEIGNCNPNYTAILTQITYSAANLAYSTDSFGHTFIDFDLMATDTPQNLLFSQGYIYLVLDSNTFGTYLVTNGKITATKGTIDSFYNLSLSDSTANILKLTLVHDSTNTLTNLDSVNTNQQLCHLRINISSFNITAVSTYFDTLAMAGRSEYSLTPNGLQFPYDKILVSGLVGAPATSCTPYTLNYKFGNQACTLNGTVPTGVSFDVQFQCSNVLPIEDLGFIVTYNTNIFYYVSNTEPGWWTNTYDNNSFYPSNAGNAIYSTSDNNSTSGSTNTGYIQMQANAIQPYDASDDPQVPKTQTSYYTYSTIVLKYQPGVTSSVGGNIQFDMNYATGTTVKNDYGCIQTDGSSNAQDFNTATANKTNQTLTIDCWDDGVGSLNGGFGLVRVFPNPFSSQFQLQYSLSESEDVYINIYDILGRSVYSQNVGIIAPGSHTNTIDLQSELPTGIYFLKMQTPNRETNIKITKE